MDCQIVVGLWQLTFRQIVSEAGVRLSDGCRYGRWIRERDRVVFEDLFLDNAIRSDEQDLVNPRPFG